MAATSAFECDAEAVSMNDPPTSLRVNAMSVGEFRDGGDVGCEVGGAVAGGAVTGGGVAVTTIVLVTVVPQQVMAARRRKPDRMEGIRMPVIMTVRLKRARVLW